MILHSIRFKVVLWYMLLLAITLTIFSVWVYEYFQFNLYKDLDSVLKSRAEGVADGMDLYWQTHSVAGGGAPLLDADIDFVKVVRHSVETEGSRDKQVDMLVHVSDVKGNRIASSLTLPSMVPLSSDTYKEVLQGRGRFDTSHVQIKNATHFQVRVYSLPVVRNGSVKYVIQVASQTIAINFALKRLRIVLLIGLPLTVFLTGVGGAFLARQSLHPVITMIHTIKAITAQHMKARVPIPDSRDEIAQLAETFNDMLVRLDTAITSQQQFLQDVSHELKTPLTVLKGQLEVTLRKVRSPEDYTGVLSSSLDEIEKLRFVVDDLLMLARLDAKEMHLEKTECEITQVVTQVMESMHVLAEEKHITFGYPQEEIKILCLCDERYMRRVIMNILSNAIKYTNPEGTVAVSITNAGALMCMVVKDTGIGIAAEDMPRIFDRFYCVSKSRGSHGLGLSIAKAIVEAHHGSISVESVLGKGTTVTVSIPLKG